MSSAPGRHRAPGSAHVPRDVGLLVALVVVVLLAVAACALVVFGPVCPLLTLAIFGGPMTVEQTYKPLSGADRRVLAADLKRRYKAGATLRELEEHTGRSYGLVRKLLIEAGVTLRRRGGATRTRKAGA